MKIEKSEFLGMSQDQLVEVVNSKFTEFKKTIDKPIKDVHLNDTIESFQILKETHQIIHSLISQEKSFWFEFREHNHAYSDWCYTSERIGAIMHEAWKIVESTDWSVYEY